MTWWRVSAEAIEQLGRGFVEQASFGVSKSFIEDKAPTVAGTQISRGIGSLLGFFAGPLKAAGAGIALSKAGLAKILGKEFVKRQFVMKGGKKVAVKGLAKLQGEIYRKGMPKILEHMGTHAATLSAAEVLSDVTDIKGMPGRAGHGAIIGTIFGSVGMMGTVRFKAFSHVIRQGAGRALMAVAQQYPPGYLTEENLPQVIFHELLNTYFFSRGLSAKAMWEGRVTPQDIKFIKNYDKAAMENNKRAGIEARLKIKPGMYKEVPTFFQWLSNALNKRYIDPQGVADIMGTHTVFYDMKTKTLRPIFQGMRGNFKASATELEYKIKEGREPELVDIGKKLDDGTPEFMQGEITAKNAVLDLMHIPMAEIPHNYKKILDKKIAGILPDMGRKGGNDLVNILYAALEMNPKELRMKDLFRIEKSLQNISKAPYGQEFTEMFREFREKYQLEGPLEDLVADAANYGVAGKDIISDIGHTLRKRTSIWNHLKLKHKNDPRKLLQNLFTVGFWEGWLDIRKNLHKMERNTSIPIWAVYKQIMAAEGKVLQEMFDLLKDFEIVADQSKANQAGVKEHYWNRWTNFERHQHETKTLLKLVKGPLSKPIARAEYDALERVGKVEVAALDKKGNIYALPQEYIKSTDMLPVALSKHKELSFLKALSPKEFEKYTGFVVNDTFISSADIGKYKSRYDAYKANYEPRRSLPSFEQMNKFNAMRERDLDARNAEALEKLNPMQRQSVELINTLMEKLAPLVREQRFMLWYESYLDVRKKNPGRSKEFLFSKTKQIYTTQAELGELLLRGQRIAEKALARGGDKKMLDAWLEGEANMLGLIEAGNYLPGVLSGKFDPKMHSELAQRMDSLSLTHLKSRGKEYHVEESPKKLQDFLEEAFFAEPLNVIIHNYTRDIVNGAYLKAPLQKMDKLLGMLNVDGHLSAAKRSPFGKEYSFMDMMRLYTHRVRGLPIKVGAIMKIVKMTQSVFFRSLVLRPRLWLRNLFQQFVTNPARKATLDPKYALKRLKSLPYDQQMRYARQVSQFESFARDWMMWDETQWLRKVPFIGRGVKIAEKVGKIYAHTDEINRGTVYAKVFLRGLDKMHNWAGTEKTKKSWNKLMRELNVHNIDEEIQRAQIKDLIAKGDYTESAARLGEFMATNSQWVYKRSGKSIWEMTGGGESFTNLITWSKGIGQRAGMIFKNLGEGYERKDMRMIGAAGAELGGLMLSGYIAGEILASLTVSHKKKYSDYGFDAFAWEFGGVGLDLVRGFTERIGDLVTAYDDPPEVRAKAMEEFAKYIDNIWIRQLLPFAKMGLGMAEAVTGQSYISPIYNLVMKKGISKVDRTLYEGIAHAFFASDPNKGKAVRDWAGKAKQEWERKMRHATNPVSKAYATAKYKRYKYFDDLFSRYQPIEVYKYYYERAERQALEEYDSAGEEASMEDKEQLQERKYRMGYY